MHWAMVYPRRPPRARLSSSLQTPEVCHLFSFPPRQHVPLCPLGFWMSGDRPLLPWSLEEVDLRNMLDEFSFRGDDPPLPTIHQ